MMEEQIQRTQINSPKNSGDRKSQDTPGMDINCTERTHNSSIQVGESCEGDSANPSDISPHGNPPKLQLQIARISNEEAIAGALTSPEGIVRVPQSPTVIIGQDVFQIIDDCPPPAAPFPHRFVTLHPADVSSLYDMNMDETLGGGRFGEVHLCTEKSSGLHLVGKILSSKDREMALNEIQVMNQLDHPYIIQMFDAVEMPNEIFLILEYVEGGMLFERIIDESFQLMEVDAMVYVRQICEGIFYMHQMYVLHLDLKPENIVCVSPISHMVKIIDFGLARRYKPQNKLKVSFGTAEFLSPEVINFDFVSFPTDMWSVGVITYMMVSGLSPFLGDNEPETLNNVLSCDTGFDEEPFESVSDEAKDFISNLLVKEKNGRMSAAQCLRHPWLNNLDKKAKLCHRLLKSQIELRKYMMRRRWKKNVFAVTAAHRLMKISSSGCLASMAE